MAQSDNTIVLPLVFEIGTGRLPFFVVLLLPNFFRLDCETRGVARASLFDSTSIAVESTLPPVFSRLFMLDLLLSRGGDDPGVGAMLFLRRFLSGIDSASLSSDSCFFGTCFVRFLGGDVFDFRGLPISLRER